MFCGVEEENGFFLGEEEGSGFISQRTCSQSMSSRDPVKSCKLSRVGHGQCLDKSQPANLGAAARDSVGDSLRLNSEPLPPWGSEEDTMLSSFC